MVNVSADTEPRIAMKRRPTRLRFRILIFPCRWTQKAAPLLLNRLSGARQSLRWALRSARIRVAMEIKPYLRSISIDRGDVAADAGYPFDIPAIRKLKRLD